MLKDFGSGHQREQFRDDVHALRAIAALLVVFFHLDVAAFGGGFVGVDVFFVISGFVIFRKIISECRRGEFSALGFYRQRFFRIFPALLTTIIITMLVGCILLTPKELSNLGGSALASAFSVANIYFADRLGYFAPATITTPLIHYWVTGLR